MDYLSGLESDYRRLAEVSAGNLAAPVPSCPEWTVDDLVRHVAMVYLHKVECMRLNAMPKPWPPDLSAEEPLALLDRAYADLAAEFATRDAESPAATWYEPDNSVGFWRRRMAQETVIHRIDGELAASVPSLPIPGDLALDGIDEVLLIFVMWACQQWPEDFAEELSKGDGAVAVSVGPSRWLVSWNGSAVKAAISDSAADGDGAAGAADAEVAGSPDAVLRWLWGRADESAVVITGDLAKIAQLRGILRAGTQ